MSGGVDVILNPVAGPSSSRRLLKHLIARLGEAGVRTRIFETQGPGDASAAARRSCEEGAKALVVFGGDGTVSDAAGGMVGEGVPIVIAPMGTENILAKHFGSRADASWLTMLLQDGRETAMDVAAMNGRRFLFIAGIGFDAEVVRRLTLARRGHITHFDYLWPIWRTFWSFRHPHVSVEADGQIIHEGRGLVFVGNLRRYAGGLRICSRASASDGRLDVCVYCCCRRAGLLRHSLNTVFRRHVGTRGVVYAQARRVRVWSEDPVGVQLDGDLAESLPGEFEMLPQRVRFLVPADWRE